MASDLSYVACIKDGLSCCVCFELCVDPHTPKDLNCPHVICEVCLKRLMKGRAIDCPQCRLITRVPEKGVAALKTNLGIRNLAETHQRHAQKKDQQIQSSLSTISHRAKVPVGLINNYWVFSIINALFQQVMFFQLINKFAT